MPGEVTAVRSWRAARLAPVAAVAAAATVAAACGAELEAEEPGASTAGLVDTGAVEPAPSVEAEAPTADRPGRRPVVAAVIDGDTIELRNGTRVRLVQIDAPETGGECYSRKATRVLREILPEGTEVRLVADPKLDRRDDFGRLLRYVFTGDMNVNLALVKRGAASVWFYEGSGDGTRGS
jgi:endonuclease YncB( thermonuclease family)